MVGLGLALVLCLKNSRFSLFQDGRDGEKNRQSATQLQAVNLETTKIGLVSPAAQNTIPYILSSRGDAAKFNRHLYAMNGTAYKCLDVMRRK
jgi:hypothetical protein